MENKHEDKPRSKVDTVMGPRFPDERQMREALDERKKRRRNGDEDDREDECNHDGADPANKCAHRIILAKCVLAVLGMVTDKRRSIESGNISPSRRHIRCP